jgi:hypothetical protein
MAANPAFPEDYPVTPAYRSEVKLSWGALFGGVFVTLGVWVLLTVLGLAIGLSSIDPSDPHTLKSAGIGAGIWSAIVPILSLFCGGLVASRTAGIVDRSTGSMHGFVLWGFTIIASVAMTGMIVRGLVGVVASVGSGVASAAGQVMGEGARSGPQIGAALGIDANDLVGPINQELRSQGKPTVTADQLEAATRDVAQSAIREGRLDKQLLVSRVSEHTRLSQADSRQIADRIEAKWNEQRTSLEQTGRDVQTKALQAGESTGHAMWWAFLGMVLGLGSAVLGATLGVSRRQRRAASERIPLATTREAHT